MTDPVSPHDRVARAVAEGRPVEAQYARQGRRGNRILWLLLASTFLAALILLGMVLGNEGEFSSTAEDIGRQPQDAQLFDQDERLPAKARSGENAPVSPN